MESITRGKAGADANLAGGASRHGRTTLRRELGRQPQARPGDVHVALSGGFGLAATQVAPEAFRAIEPAPAPLINGNAIPACLTI